MRETPALRRAQLGGALRAVRSELQGPRYGAPAGSTIPDEVRTFAERLEEASPGLALMMQLRARLFEHAVRTAKARGFRLVVTVGFGFARPWLRRLAGRHVRLVEIEHPDVVASEPRMRAAERLPAADFARDAWRVLAARGCDPRAYRTLFLLEGLSLWGGEAALVGWLRVLEHARPGTELLMNALDEGVVAHARDAAHGLAGLSGSSVFAAESGVSSAWRPSAIRTRGLEIVRLFDSADVQRAALGVADSFMAERYVWLRVPEPSAANRSIRSVAPPWPARRWSAHDEVAFPRLRPMVEMRAGTRGAVMALPVTSLRAVATTLSDAERRAAMLFDGRHSIPRIVGITRRAGGPPLDAAALAVRLWARGFLAGEGAGCELDALRGEAFDALDHGDTCRGRRVARRLAAYRGNAAARHLRAVLQARPWPRLARDGALAVLTPADGTVDAAAIVATAHLHVGAVGRLLGVRADASVLIDVSSARRATPMTIVGEAEPYTLVRIPSSAYSAAILCHELVHATAMAGSSWLSEGLAVWVQRSTTRDRCYPDDGDAPAAVARRPLDASLLTGAAGGDAAGRRLGRADYLEAAAFVEWIVRRVGVPAFLWFFRACRPFCTVTEVSAAVAALGWPSFGDLDADWRESRR